MKTSSEITVNHELKISEYILYIAVLALAAYIFYQYCYYLGFLTLLYIILHILNCKYKQVLDITGKGVIITGCDTGFGHDLAKRLSSKGIVVFAGVLSDHSEGAQTLRKLKSKYLHVMKLDVTNDDDVQEAVKHITKSKAALWGIVNNAGFNIPGDVELCTIDQYKKCAEVNLYGVIRITKAFLPLVRKSKGRIVNVSSVKARISWPSDSIYMVSKYGMETISDSLRLELKKFGVNVSVVEPGNYGGATSCNDSTQIKRMTSELEVMWNKATEEVREAYGRQYFDNMAGKLETSLESSASFTDPVINDLEDALVNVNPKPRYLVAGGNGLVDARVCLARVYGFIPESVMDFLVCKLSGCDKFPDENK